jgi:hypothetical protein
MVNAASVANSARRPTILLSEPSLREKSEVENPDTLRNFHIPPAHAGYTRQQGL